MRIDHTIEKGKKIIREKHIDFTVFKSIVSHYLHNANKLDEDDWVRYYNDYARCVGSSGFEELNDWVQEWFQEYNKEETRIWLKK